LGFPDKRTYPFNAGRERKQDREDNCGFCEVLIQGWPVVFVSESTESQSERERERERKREREKSHGRA
jgi:hypothetical protein